MGVRRSSAARVTPPHYRIDARTRRHLGLYAAIGALAVSIDVGLFRFFIGAGWIAESAAVCSGGASMAVHFTLNKYLNFRDHSRSLRDQLGTYAAVALVWWIVTLGVVAVMTRVFLAPPVVAKLVAVAINFPFGFLAQRYLTFGAGIAALVRRRLKPP
jgi:putative flippase GtrA